MTKRLRVQLLVGSLSSDYYLDLRKKTVQFI